MAVEGTPAPKGSSLRTRAVEPVAPAPKPSAPPKETPKAKEPEGKAAPTAEEFAATTTRLAELEAKETARLERVKTRNDERIKALPEKAQKAIAKLTAKLDADEVSDFLDEDLADLVPEADTRPAGGRRATGTTADEPIPAAATKEWERYGKKLNQSERDYYERVWKPRQKKS
jgi:hypothetical protein